MKLLWRGTDSLMLINYSMRKWYKRPYWFIFRRMIRIMDFFIDGHICVSPQIANNVSIFGTRKHIEIIPNQPKYSERMPKIPHKGFNVVYYLPSSRKDKDFVRWLYGLDVIDMIKRRMHFVTFIPVDGTRDMSEVYPTTDFILRPNRHDGASRMIMEAKINDIPYYWSTSEPSIVDCVIKILNEYNKYETNNRDNGDRS